MKPIKVSEKALAHLSKGLYRSPASALRELVSNAWDASATMVEITTSVPAFNRLVITDNGNGFNRTDFEKLMENGIGNSLKRSAHSRDEKPAFDRPILGRLGIGLLGVAQICSRFRIQSKNRRGEVFAAELRIQDALRRRLDQDDPAVVQEVVTPEGTFDVVSVGSWEFVEAHDLPEGKWTGTQILVISPLASFTESFIATLRPIAKDSDEQEDEMADRVTRPRFPTPAESQEAMPPLDWKLAVRRIAEIESVMMRGDYWRFLWELSVTCPLKYFSEGAAPNKCIVEDQRRLEAYNFTLRVDGRELRKPVWLQPRENGYTVRPFNHDLTTELGRPLRFHGYIVVQEGKQLRPAELRGVLVRIKEVGVGYYDPTLLDWQTNQGPRSRWVTGEIFVEEGLEDAMNVDRDSFNRYHPEFKAIQRAVHKELSILFKRTYKKIQERSDARHEERSGKRTEGIVRAIKALTGRETSIVHRAPQFLLSGAAPKPSDVIQRRKDHITVNLGVTDSLDTKKSQKELAAAIVALYDATMLTAHSEEERR